MIAKIITTAAALAFSVATFAATPSTQSSTQHMMTTKRQQSLTPKQALDKLHEGNLRFVNAKSRNLDLLELAKKSGTKGQAPFAMVLSCMDSRSIPDMVFDQGLGNVFVARDAGNVASPTIYASMEFAVQAMGAHLIVVMGHTGCGAVRAACEGKGSGHIKGLLAKIRPAVLAVEKQTGDKNCESAQLVNQIARQNVIEQINGILKNVPAFDKLIAEKKLMIVGAMHNLKTGKVEFFNSEGKDLYNN